MDHVLPLYEQGKEYVLCSQSWRYICPRVENVWNSIRDDNKYMQECRLERLTVLFF